VRGHLAAAGRVDAAGHLLRQRLGEGPPERQGQGEVAVVREDPVASGVERVGGADLRRLVTRGGGDEADPPLALQGRQALVEASSAEHVAVDRPQAGLVEVAGERRDPTAVVVDDADGGFAEGFEAPDVPDHAYLLSLRTRAS